MGKLKHGFFGPFTGKVGNLVGYVLNGQSIIRTKSAKSNIPRTEKQLATQQKMKVVSGFLRSMTEFIRIGFSLRAEGQIFSAMNAATSYHLKYAVKGEYPNYEPDYSKAVLTSGSLPHASDPQVKVVKKGLKFTWKVHDKGSNDQVMLLAYFPEINESIYMLSGARRSEGKEILMLDAPLKGKAAETYISFISDNRKSIAKSVYVGRILF